VSLLATSPRPGPWRLPAPAPARAAAGAAAAVSAAGVAYGPERAVRGRPPLATPRACLA
jgi:hypothetical protein